MNNLFPIHHTRAGRFPPIYRPALFLCQLVFFGSGFFRFSCIAFKLLLIFSVSHCLTGLSTDLFGQSEWSQRASSLKQKSTEHKRYIDSILNKKQPSFSPDSLPVKPSLERVSQQPTVPVPRPTPVRSNWRLPEVDLPNAPKEQSQGFVSDNSELSYASPDAKTEKSNLHLSEEDSLKEAYNDLYETNIPERRLGYYFGPFAGVVFPDDISINGESFQSGNGGLLGLRVGRDFGFIRVEGDYSYLSFDSKPSGSVTLHNFLSRFILEKEMAERADFRVGLGIGLSALGSGSENEICFAYDFLIGWSYRFDDHWGLAFDYRHFLTSASQTFNRVQGHILEVSANFDF